MNTFRLSVPLSRKMHLDFMNISTGDVGVQELFERQLSIGLEWHFLLKVLVLIMFFSAFVYKT